MSSETFFSIKTVFPFSSRCRNPVIERVLIELELLIHREHSTSLRTKPIENLGSRRMEERFVPSSSLLSSLSLTSHLVSSRLSVVVCIVSDGRAKINSRTLSVLAAMGVYQDGVAKNVVAGKPVTGHLYEYTTQVSVDPDLKMKSAERGIVPVQM